MALSAKHRSRIYEQLSPMLGEEEAEALLSQFPSRDLDEPVTKEFVRAEIGDLRTDLHDRLGELGTELRGEMAELGRGLRGEMAELGRGLRGEMAELGTELRAEIGDLRTELRGEMAELGTELRAEIGDVRTELHDRLREQTMWMTGAVFAGMGVAAAIGSLVG